MKKVLSFSACMLSVINLTAAPQMPVLVTCKVTKTGQEFGAKGKDCTPEAQKSACSKYDTDPLLGPSTPTGCTTFTSVDQLTDALTKAASTRNPQGAATLKAIAEYDPEKTPPPAAVGILCKLKNPKPNQAPLFATLAPLPEDPKLGQCSFAQEKCGIFEKSPQLGPADWDGVTCKKFKNDKELNDWVQSFVALGTYVGDGSSVITCKTRGQGIEYNVIVPYTDPLCSNIEDFKRACQTDQGIADPVPACNSFASDLEVTQELEKKPKLFGLQCQFKVGGFGKREVVPDCSKAIMELSCPSKDLDVLSCTKFPTAKAATEWSKEFFNTGLVNCKTDSGIMVGIPTMDCSPESQRKACPKNMTPVGCTRELNVERLKKLAEESAAAEAKK